MDKHNVTNALAALGGNKPAKTGTGPVASQIETSGEAVEDLGALVGANEGVSQELLALARQTALAADASREAGAKAKALKAELEEAMKLAAITEIALSDRDPIAFETTTAKSKTLKALKQRMADTAKEKLAEGKDPKVAEAEAHAQAKTIWSEFWGRFPVLPSTSLGIPKPKIIEPEPDEE